eukprot:SAG31_NODE_6289_length_2082_cov_1.398891_1_plen_248_part_10
MTDLCSSQDAKFTDKFTYFDERLQDSNDHLSEMIAAASKRTAEAVDVEVTTRAELITQLDNRFAEKISVHDERLEELSSVTLEHHRQFSSLCANLDKKIGVEAEEQYERLLQIDRKHAAIEDELSKQLTDRLAELTSKNAAQDSLADEHHRHFSSVCNALDANHTKDIAELNAQLAGYRDHFSEVCETIDSKYAAKTVAQDETVVQVQKAIDEQHRYFTSVYSKLENALSDAVAATTERAKSDYEHLN